MGKPTEWMRFGLCRDTRSEEQQNGRPKAETLLITKSVTVPVRITAGGNVTAPGAHEGWKSQKAVQWRKITGKGITITDRGQLREFGFDDGYRERPIWMPTELTTTMVGRIYRGHNPKYRPPRSDAEEWVLVEAISEGLQTHLAEHLAKLRGVTNEGEEHARRGVERHDYAELEAKAEAAAKVAYEAATTEDEAAERGRHAFRATQVRKKRRIEALRRWPLDLTKNCLGDAGDLGELALVQEEKGEVMSYV